MIHSGIKCSCSECPKVFSRKDKLNAHMRKKHSQSSPNDAEDCLVEDQLPVDPIEEGVIEGELGVKFECPDCQELVGDLAEHCMEKHGNEEVELNKDA